MEINLPFDSSEQTMELIKLAALYYDRVNVVCPESFEGERIEFFSQNLLGRTNILHDRGVIAKNTICVDDGSDDVIDFVCNELLDDNISLLFNDKQIFDSYRNTTNNNSALEKALKDLCGVAQIFSDEQFSIGIAIHCAAQLTMLYETICENKNCISSNELYGRWLSQILQKKGALELNRGIHQDPMTALDITPILLPNYSNLDYEDILEMRLKAGDELQELRCYLGELSSKYDAEDKALTTAKDFIERDIRRAVTQFENKAKGLRKETIQRALKSMANPLSYAPMLTTFIKEVPLWVSAGLSMGIITAEAAVEYSKQKDKLKDDPLYFTVKLNKYGKGKR